MEIAAVNNRYNIATKSQYEVQQDSLQNYGDYNNYDNYAMTDPMAMDYPAYEEEDTKPKIGLGMVALGLLGAAGIGIGIWKGNVAAKAEKALAEAKTELSKATEKITELETKANTAEEALKAANKTIEELKNPPKKGFWASISNWFPFGKKPTKF